ncbi:HPr family phosphocarrier protein [Halococcus saccharolyticus]|uniref:HPr family phosphocarrier protein n=1 Tax=Halococcus saccharolyticus TaxID=62319 RepID=UPI00403FE133
MTERVVTVVPEAGLHARPASTFVRTANEFDADIEIAPIEGEPVNARSMLAVTGLGVESGEDVRLFVEGADAAAALDALEAVLSTPEESSGEREDGDGGTDEVVEDGNGTEKG